MSFPLTDWQFYVVTAVCLAGVWILVRPMFPGRRENDTGCGNCAVGNAAKAGSQTSLTVEGKNVG